MIFYSFFNSKMVFNFSKWLILWKFLLMIILFFNAYFSKIFFSNYTCKIVIFIIPQSVFLIWFFNVIYHVVSLIINKAFYFYHPKFRNMFLFYNFFSIRKLLILKPKTLQIYVKIQFSVDKFISPNIYKLGKYLYDFMTNSIEIWYYPNT